MKEVIILARGNSRKHCPYDAEVWGVNNVYAKPDVIGKRIDKLFAFDPLPEDFIREMKEVAPIVSWQDYADEVYPLKEIINEFKTEYVCNTICYMIALAIYWGYDRIRLYGVDQPVGSPWMEDRTGVEYWIGRAQERGIEVIPTEGSEVLRTRDGLIYGQGGNGSRVLYLFERFALLCLLPQSGDIETVRQVAPARHTLGFTETETKEHKISWYKDGDEMRFNCDGEAVPRNFVLSEEVCGIISDRLIKLEREKSLPVRYWSLYEKFVKEQR